jgi:peptidoglycan hydrolase-like protein with peptidoglycan-binding domain
MENGMVGSDVQLTQKMLKSLEYYSGATDGIFGNGLERAVRRFQRDNRLGEDGIVGRRTYEKICALSGE